ncbi:39S ribosomal protein L19, mitochondrial-like [Gigantopelta aegis]|uniref:39S ribosomal protein L19, mitochondrial-like n=1 Tax=Gigantopelta aegis TaxID=1735272 RepID=UPI001B88A29E|nr:39S ribosomal protein L19, mitochondrial-like [Gigantopelta aegis]
MASIVRKVLNLKLSRIYAAVPKRHRSGRNYIQRVNYLENDVVEDHRQSPLSKQQEVQQQQWDREALNVPRDFRYVYPDFLPNPEPKHRDRICELLEREDMYRRRAVIDLPEFYVGSIMAVKVADAHSPGKTNRFVGICIQRGGHGLRSYFILRNVIDGQGIEIMYEMYSPVLQNIEVLRLEKRLDDDLMYLRDAPHEFSTVPMDMEATPLPKGTTVPINTVMVRLNPRPWHQRWERCDLKGVEPFEVSQKLRDKAKKVAKPWEKYDLMKHYRETINDDESDTIMREIYSKKVHETRKSRTLTKKT